MYLTSFPKAEVSSKMGRVTIIFWTFILFTTLLVEAKDIQQSGFRQKDFRRHPSSHQRARTHPSPWKQGAFSYKKQTWNRRVRDTDILTTSPPTNTELTTSTPEVLNTDTSTFKDSGSSDDPESKTGSTVAAKLRKNTEVIPETTTYSAVEEPVSSTTTTTTGDDNQRNDNLLYTTKPTGRKSEKRHMNKSRRNIKKCKPPHKLVKGAEPLCIKQGKSINAPTAHSIGGVRTTIEEHLYQVSLQYIDHPFCGGTILNRDTILTAAHCFDEIKRNLYDFVAVKVGATDRSKGQKYNISKVIPHTNYDKEAHNNDIAIVKLTSPLTYSNKVWPIKLQPAGKPIPPGTQGVVTGWGTTKADEYAIPSALRKVTVGIISNEQCQHMYKPAGRVITMSMLCAFTPGRDSCQGDSGGPLVAHGKLIGVVSWGIGCADPKYPGVYVNISAMHGFINQFVK